MQLSLSCLFPGLFFKHPDHLFKVLILKGLYCDLQKLALQKQENLTTLALQCQCLQEVDLTDCESLTNSICEVFSDGGGVPYAKNISS